MSAPVIVEVQNVSSAGQVPQSELIGAWVREILSVVHPGEDSAVEIAVRIVDENESRELNHRFRHVDKATNVLAFPTDDQELAALRYESEPLALGDLVICGPVVLREAAEQSKSPHDHWLHLILHGILHLLGYDHEKAQEAAEMEALESRILAARGIADPYRDR